jgi:hypothetical protein
MQQSCTYGSVRGASGNWRPYRDKMASDGILLSSDFFLLRVDFAFWRGPRIGVEAQNTLLLGLTRFELPATSDSAFVRGYKQ